MNFTVDINCAGLPDSHLHTKYSFDSELEPAAHAEDAAALGLCSITFTDHVDLTVPGTVRTDEYSAHWSEEDIIAASAAARELNEKYDSVEIYAGVELGQAIFDPQTAARVLSLADFDFVLGSMHERANGQDYYYIDFSLPDNDPYQYYAEYLDNIMKLVRYGDFDSLAHLTYMLRYVIGRYRIPFDESRFYSDYDRILTALARGGKALEINTSGVRRENGFMLPGLRMVARFRELGGKYITLGSDAHRAGHIGAGLREGAEMAKAAGFDSVAVYKSRKPRLIKL